jgi:lipoprotein-anchoring transpeptidase ErfK/SrfK
MSTSASTSSRARDRVPVRTGAIALAAVAALTLAGCGGTSSPSADPQEGNSAAAVPGAGQTQDAVPAVDVRISANVKHAKPVAVDTAVRVRTSSGRLHDVSLTTAAGASVAGTIASDGSSWQADALLEPGTAYVLKAAASSAQGADTTWTRRFHTQSLSLAQQTYASIAPLDGQKVGVGFPVIVRFDVPVTDRASIEKHLSVQAQPAQQGSWHWLSDTEVHWRPRHYWKAGSTVTVHADVNSVPAGHGIYGQSDRAVTFHVGDRHVYRVNLKTDQMKVYSNRKLLRTIPVTAGQPGFITRSGIKVIVQKYEKHTMNSETIGIPKGDPNYYNMKDVQWAMRMTYSGEFIHAAPWSVGSQGRANVSHGCTGISTANAEWLYHLTRVGDVVDEYGSDRPMEVANGYGDWNMSFQDYKAGSALASAKS